MPENVLDQLCEMFRAGNAQFRVLHHEAAGKTSQSVAEIRGTELGQGAKALCCTVKGNGAFFLKPRSINLSAPSRRFG